MESREIFKKKSFVVDSNINFSNFVSLSYNIQIQWQLNKFKIKVLNIFNKSINKAENKI